MANRTPLKTRTPSVVQFAETLSDDKLQIIKELFTVFDENKDGSLDKKELRNLMRELQVFLADEELDDLFKHLDINNDGKVQREEFVKGLKWIQKAVQLGKQETSKEKPKLQKSKSFFNFASQMNEEEIKTMRELFQICDEDKDGVVTKAQLWKLMQKLDLSIEKEEYETFWNDLDKKNDGKLTFDEFLLGLRWIQKGAEMNTKNKNSQISLQQKFDMLQAYVKEVIDKSTELANKQAKSNRADVASLILEPIDYTILKTIEEYVGPLVTKTAEKNYQETISKMAKK